MFFENSGFLTRFLNYGLEIYNNLSDNSLLGSGCKAVLSIMSIIKHPSQPRHVNS